MKDLPLISVIVPVYNVEKYLDQCIASIVGQTYENLEIILVDDGSPDGSPEICDAWAAKDSRIRVIHQQNSGGGAARNAALDVAAGALLAFVDSDDYIAPDMLEYLYGLLNQGADIAECGYLTTETNDAVFPEYVGECRAYTKEEALSCHIQDTIFRQLIWNKLYRREMVGDIRFPVGTKIDDEFFTYRVLAKANMLVQSDKVCYAYRQQAGSVMHQKNPVKIRESIRAKQQRLAFLGEALPSLEEEARVELFMTCIYCLQACLREKENEAFQNIQKEVLLALEALKPLQLDGAASQKQKLLLRLGQHWPLGVSKLLNLLIDLHILT